MTLLECEDCGLQEREEWAPNHKCNTITDLKTPVGTKTRYLRIGKNRFLTIKPNKSKV